MSAAGTSSPSEVELKGFTRAIEIIVDALGLEEPTRDEVLAKFTDWHEDNESMQPFVGCPDAQEFPAF